jgi:hypothetical protein
MAAATGESAARQLVNEIREELAGIDGEIREHAYPGGFERSEVPLEALRPFVATEYYVAQSDLRSFGGMTQRFGEKPATRAFFASVYQSEDAAVNGLFKLAERLGFTVEELEAFEVEPTGFGYAAYVAWLAEYATAAEVAAALLVNFGAWGNNCRRLRDSLKASYGLTDADTVYLDTFADLPHHPPFEAEALRIVQDGIDEGVPEHKIRRAPRLLQGYEKLFWDTIHSYAPEPDRM